MWAEDKRFPGKVILTFSEVFNWEGILLQILLSWKCISMKVSLNKSCGHFIARRCPRVQGGKEEKAWFEKKRERTWVSLGLASWKVVIFYFRTLTMECVGGAGR